MTKRLFCAVSQYDVLSVVQDKNGVTQRLYLGGEQISNQEWKNLYEEVKFLEASKLYPILFATLNEQAKLRMFEQSKSDADIMFGKATLWTLDVQRKLLAAIKQYKA
jgi:hypothetical protein